MANLGKWSDELKKRLEDLLKKSGYNRDKFVELINIDEELKNKGVPACLRKAHRDGRLKGVNWSGRYIATNLSEDQRHKLDNMLTNSQVSLEDVLKEFPQFENRSKLYNYAKYNNIRINKGRVPAYEKRLSELVQGGMLVQVGLDKLLGTLKLEFPDHAKRLNKKVIAADVERVIWDKKTEEALRVVVGYGLPLDRFSKYHQHIPPDMLKRKAKSLTGLSRIEHPVTFLKGMGRIGDIEGLDDSFQLPKSNISNPYLISTKRADPQVSVINGSNIGLRHKRLIKENPLRRALADANMRGDDAVFIVNPFDIEIKKAAGGLRVQKSFASGLNVNLKLLDPYYRKRLSQDEDSIIYETVAERFINILSGLAKIAKRPDEEPEFAGQVLVILGYKEEQIIANAVAWELGYQTRLKQEEIEVEIKVINLAVSKGHHELREELENLVALKARTIQSNISDEELQKYARKVMNFVVARIEGSIPNAKVIGQGTTFVKIGDNVVEFNIPQDLRVTDNLLKNYNQTHGARSIMGQVAKTTVICHPYSLNFRMAAREINIQNKRAEARVYVAPIVVDGQFLREALRDSVRSAHPISKVVFSSQFNPGVLRLGFHKGIAHADRVPIQALSRRSKPVYGKKSDHKHIWIMVATDPHFGSRMREEVWSDSAKGSLGVSDAVIQMLRDAKLCEGDKLPVHIYSVNDDPTQGNHFDTHKQPHPRQMSYQEIEKRIQGLSAEEAKRFALEQLRLRGSDWLEEQVQQVKERHILPNLDFFNGILNRVKKSGLIIRGISDIHGVVHDRRDLGAINWGTGNHFESTVERVMTEGGIYADYLRALLYGSNGWKNKKELVDKLVAAPLEGNQYFAWGTIRVPGGYEWAVEFRSNPPRLSSWADPLLAAVRNDALRGDYGLFMTGRKTVKIYGDKHFFAAVDAEHVFYHICASGTSTDLYGHRGFPPNNTGVSFVGLPVDGPESGPILLRPLHVEHIRSYFDNPSDFDWEKFLPNSA